MLKKEKCLNMNHSKLNVLVRNCSMCGEIVNKSIAKKNCHDEEHFRLRKERSLFCSSCGKSLKL